MSETTTTPTIEPTPDRERGWLIECPSCQATWKVVRDDIMIGDGRWQQCPTCLDVASRRLPEDVG